jgi:hypothetical protein
LLLYRPVLHLQQLRTADVRISFRAYAPTDILLVVIQNGGAVHGDALGGTAMLDMCYATMALLEGEHTGLHTAKDNPQAFQGKLRVSPHSHGRCSKIDSAYCRALDSISILFSGGGPR